RALRPPFQIRCWIVLCPGRGAGLGTAGVVAIAAIDRLSAHGRERNFGGDSAAVAGHADHGALAGSAVAFAGGLSLVAAVLATLRFVREATLCVEGLLVLAEQELASTVCTIESFIVECVHETLIS